MNLNDGVKYGEAASSWRSEKRRVLNVAHLLLFADQPSILHTRILHLFYSACAMFWHVILSPSLHATTCQQHSGVSACGENDAYVANSGMARCV